MRHFLVTVLRNKHFNSESDLISQHVEYLTQLQSRKQVLYFGGFTDKTGGAYLLKADSLTKAEEIANNDPLIVSGMSNLNIKEWNI